MYVPKHFAETDRNVLHRLIDAHPLGAWITLVDDTLEVNHIPFLIERDAGESGTLVGHVAKANPVWRTASTTVASVVIFQGPEAYISPSWYPAKKQHGKVVPTWDYAVVHAHGMPRVIHDKKWLLGLVDKLTTKHEAGRRAPWQVADAPADYVDKLLEGIVGIEVPIARLEGKWKVSQNRPSETGAIIRGLREQPDAESQAMARLLEERS